MEASENMNVFVIISLGISHPWKLGLNGMRSLSLGDQIPPQKKGNSPYKYDCTVDGSEIIMEIRYSLSKF